MKSNPIVPYILIMVLGLGLIFFLGIKGLGDAKELAQGEGDTEVAEAFDPESYSKSCISCHGENLEGSGATPSLHGTGLSKEEIADILENGQGGMPGGLVPADNIDEMAEWIANLK